MCAVQVGDERQSCEAPVFYHVSHPSVLAQRAPGTTCALRGAKEQLPTDTKEQSVQAERLVWYLLRLNSFATAAAQPASVFGPS